MTRLLITWLIVLSAAVASGAIFEVGQNRQYSTVGAVPWESLQAGDTVLIHWRTNAYREKWVICRQGTLAAPITVRGVAGPDGQLPVINGNSATTRSALNYWNENRGVIK